MLKEMEDPVYDKDLNAPQEDTTSIVDFYDRAVYSVIKSEGYTEWKYDKNTGEKVRVDHPGAGRPVYDPEIWVRIRAPGNKDEIRERCMRSSDKIRFPKAWARYQNQPQPESGTPLDDLPFLTLVHKAEFKGLGLKTAEDIINISDSDGQKIMGFQQLRRKVADFVEAAKGAAPAIQLRNALEEKEQELAELRMQMAELAAHVGAPPPKRRGRPPKSPPPPPVETD